MDTERALIKAKKCIIDTYKVFSVKIAHFYHIKKCLSLLHFEPNFHSILPNTLSRILSSRARMRNFAQLQMKLLIDETISYEYMETVFRNMPEFFSWIHTIFKVFKFKGK